MTNFLNELWMILTESSVWLIFGFLLAGIVHVIVPREWMLKHLGGKGIVPIVKASLLGIPLPLCSCAVIPVAAGLREQGASKGASAAFAISTPQTGEESIPLTWGLFGPFFALARPVIAVFTGLVAGVLIDLTHRNEIEIKTESVSEDSIEDPDAIALSITNADDAGAVVAKVEKKSTGSCCSSESKPKSTCCSSNEESANSCCSSAPKTTSSCCSSKPEPEPASSCCSSTPQKTGLGFFGSIREAARHGFGVMLVDLALWLTIGLIMAAIIGSIVPAGWFEEHVGSGLWPKLVMLIVGIPLYICATSSTPLAFSLVVAGLSPGAALVLLLSGPATNVATMSWLIKDLGMKALIIYLGVIAVVALGSGIIFDMLYEQFPKMLQLADRAADHEHGSHGFGYKEVAAVIFILLMAWAMGMKMRSWMNAKGWGATGSSGSGGCCSSNTGSSCGCS